MNSLGRWVGNAVVAAAVAVLVVTTLALVAGAFYLWAVAP